ncbi:histidine phosphatase family protein [Nostoc sp. MS1]|uniref:histidine phosphatase family protein n=1 Tax=Nostoc sp. MS1 TaxID=2764711 RepID=UPI001CC3E0A5|nr:histidine phosphatase family protein [Nostoc sp. MS1]BCL33860.1 phosphoglycerate mutase [Nostoc sp. MS1]
MNKTLYLVRHCQATGKNPDAPLTTEGQAQAKLLVDLLRDTGIERIISSPYVRAYQSIVPLANYLGLEIEIDHRLIERVLSPTPLDNWRKSLEETFSNLDLCFVGGESSHTAMNRGVAVVHEVLKQPINTSVIVTHGNLMTLMLKHFDQHIGYSEWANLRNPDVYYVQFCKDEIFVKHTLI